MVQLLMAGFLIQALPPAANIQPVATEVPALGEYWAGQGGYNGGLIAARGEVPAHYLIIARNDVGDHNWGGRDKESAAFSKTDGMTNTLALIAEGDHPAAKAASAHSADSHDDFYLPSCAELHHCWINVPEQILMHDPREDYEVRSPAHLFNRVPQHKRLTAQPAHLGLPIGNLSS